MVRGVVTEPSPAPSAPNADPHPPFVRELGRLELELVRQLVADPSWLVADDEAVVRWALSLARLSAVPVRADEGAAGVVELGEAGLSYRQRLHALVSSCFDGERPRRDALRAAVGPIAALAQGERAALLGTFAGCLPAASLDRATRRRPLVLAMGGGGGTGYVYVGALSVLDQAGLTPSLIAGTSMGAVIGAFRARTKGFSLGNIRQLLSRLSWRKVFRWFDTDSRFGLPATLKLGLREVIGHEFLIDDSSGLGGWGR